MTTHPSILAWRIPWTEEPGRLPVTQSDTTEATQHAHTLWVKLCLPPPNSYIEFLILSPSEWNWELLQV